MFSTLRTRFGIPGVISVIALVFAMLGGAYAASNSGEGKGATASAKKSAKGPRGPRGPKGATGAAGPAGPAGPAGAKGDTGAPGANGAAGEKGEKGAAGTNGVSVTSVPEAPGPNCTNGGAKFTSSSGNSWACNGAPGSEGPKGDPWTLGGTLPENATETGAWNLSAAPDEEWDLNELGFAFVVSESISFSVPLDSGATPHYVKAGDPVPAECENTAHAGTASVGNPEADSGHLCVYEVAGGSNNLNLFTLTSPAEFGSTTGVSGALLVFEITDAKPAFTFGTWAVTG